MDTIVGRFEDTADPSANATCTLTRDRIVAMSNTGTEAAGVTDGPAMEGGGAMDVGVGGQWMWGEGGAMDVGGKEGQWMLGDEMQREEL